ncbi:5'-3' EXONUCLEASE FAMILY PROTEIN [Salix koriyanagi]|uniref:Exonuclease 1 n=1 Tax=Salix koriyanagi TaxID=2511006 RepID=A0A9Q0SS40_9ROSI|nr:5'-3' EXONUCLEASE FAMILY PROTEIN [Salix koriyanagi]
MKPYIEPVHIKKYDGKRVGIDAYSWLHKGAYSCSMEICLNSNSEKKLRYLDYFMHRINLLRHYKITPVVVFDGGNIPCKAGTEQERYRKRKANRELAMEKLKEGNVNAATDFFQRAISITPLMAHQLIQILRSENIEFLVAPYEADAQLAYLAGLEAERGGIAAVITEDSDLLAYGCQATIFKMDRFGNGEEIVLDKVFDAAARKPSFQCFDKELFIGMCVLAGCDFLPSVPGIGISKAHSYVSKYRNLDRVLSVLKLEKGRQMPEDYSKSFIEALAVFHHARIYESNNQRLEHMKPVPQNLLESLDGKLDFLGPEIPPSVATAIAQGNLDPSTMEAFVCFRRPGCLPDPIFIQNPVQLQKSRAKVVSRQMNRSMAFLSYKTEGGAGGVLKQEPLSTESMYISEALALQRLISPPKVNSTETAVVTNDVPLKAPKNPFRIQQAEEINLDQKDSSTGQISVVIDHEKMNIPWATTR